MPLTVRPYVDADRAAYAHVKSRVYRGGAAVDPNEDVMRADTFGSVAELDGKIVGIELDIDMSCTVRGSSVRCMGIAAVGVLPEYRRGGLGLEMLTKALHFYRERGCSIASLMPFRGHYYRKAGYATCGSRISMKLPANRIPVLESDLDVWELPMDDYSAVVPCYEAFAKRYSGMNLRRDEQWRWQLGGDNRFAIYAAGNPVEAYVSTRLKWDFWAEQEIRDFAWTTDRGYRAILGFFRGLCINKTSIKWWASSEEPMLWRYDDQGMEAKYDGAMMYRAVDVRALLEAATSASDAEFRVLVVDPHMPENHGVWHVRGQAGGTLTAEKRAEDGGHDFSIAVGPFTQAVLGEPSLASLARQGAVDVRNPAGLLSAERALPHHPTFCLDFF